MANSSSLNRNETPAAHDRRLAQGRHLIRRLIEIHPEFRAPQRPATAPAPSRGPWLAQILPFPAQR